MTYWFTTAYWQWWCRRKIKFKPTVEKKQLTHLWKSCCMCGVCVCMHYGMCVFTNFWLGTCAVLSMLWHELSFTSNYYRYFDEVRDRVTWRRWNRLCLVNREMLSLCYKPVVCSVAVVVLNRHRASCHNSRNTLGSKFVNAYSAVYPRNISTDLALYVN